MPALKPVRAPAQPNPAPCAPDLPALAVITQFLAKRPCWQAGDPFEVPAELYEAGSDEMRAVMKKRGFPLPISAKCPFENFLLRGAVIVKGE